MLYNVVLDSATQQSELAIHTYIYIYIYPLFGDFLPIYVITEHWWEFSVLYSQFSSVIYFIHSSIYTHQSQSPSPCQQALLSLMSIFVNPFCKSMKFVWKFKFFYIWSNCYMEGLLPFCSFCLPSSFFVPYSQHFCLLICLLDFL